MCLGVPGRIVDIEDGDLRSGTVAFGDITKSVCLACVPEAAIGDYVIVHVGFAIGRLDPAEAERTLSLLSEMDALGDVADATEGGS
jgi:hydrogenase expression/formation protein HypC